jgi:O-antigen ligase
VTQTVSRLEKFFNYLLIFLLPTQLAIHFWPSFAFVFGIRVDYLSPTIYLTDVLFLLVFSIWAKKSYKQILLFVNQRKRYIYLFFALALFNSVFSTSLFPTIIKWIKLLELIIFGYYVWERSEIFNIRKILPVLYYSLIFFSVIGISQFALGKTLGGVTYLFGERSFNVATPGIALVEIMGRSFMRAYSTFSHPNSFAGYLGVGLILLFLNYSRKELFKKLFGISIIFLALFLTFSLSAALGIFVCVLLILGKKIVNTKNVITISLTLLVISLALPFASKSILSNKNNFPQNVSQRLELSVGAGKLISQDFLKGVGLNTFVINASKIENNNYYLWLLQPVHNIYLLIFSETGVIGLIVAYYLLITVLNKSFLLNKPIFLSLIFILVTGLFDHYWFTLQQNMLLLAFIFGVSLREEGVSTHPRIKNSWYP